MSELRVWAALDASAGYREIARNARRVAALEEEAEKDGLRVGFTGDHEYQQIYVIGDEKRIVALMERVRDRHGEDEYTVDASSNRVADRLPEGLFGQVDIEDDLGLAEEDED
jgi:hypothetical protein